MKKLPPGWPRISSSPCYDDAKKAIDWLCKAFGFVVRLKVEHDGLIAHSELTLGEGLIMIGSKRPDRGYRHSPKSLDGANTQSMMVLVDDVDAHCKKARKAGAKIASPLTTTDYGEEYWVDRSYEAVDLEGHHWWFVQRMSTGKQKKKKKKKR